MTDEPILPERRHSVRFRAAKPATILAGHDSVPCLMRDFSAGGARLRLEDPGIVPEDFLLQIGHADPRPCRIVWRAQHQLGIAFVQRAG